MIREELYQREERTLSKYAMLCRNSRGREVPIPESELRTEYMRDRDRIVHSKAFRRLKDKTQVFINPEGSHYRTRLTHTMEVSQIARTITRALALNDDLTEAIALGHDLGHTPFGHAGERAIARFLEDNTGGKKTFLHNVQSLRIVEKLEKDGEGLNLTWEVRDGILNHKKNMQPATLEGMAVNFADRIAYLNHDIDDALRAGIITVDQMPSECLDVLGHTHSKRINTMITDIVTHSIGQPRLTMSEEVARATDLLRNFMF
ncbi:MAG: deoxyguanosinetriphosphate triphosphohydrolase, partial [Christensenellaceae bacterium]|nr:deoxyguanosinetriphosphate triphosphohydrolase [Christensenellaceae bacterium]